MKIAFSKVDSKEVKVIQPSLKYVDGTNAQTIKGYKLKSNILSKNDIKNVFTALNGLMSIDGSSDLTNLIAKLIPEETSTVFSQSDYVIDLSSWFQDSITGIYTVFVRRSRISVCLRSIELLTLKLWGLVLIVRQLKK